MFLGGNDGASKITEGIMYAYYSLKCSTRKRSWGILLIQILREEKGGGGGLEGGRFKTLVQIPGLSWT